MAPWRSMILRVTMAGLLALGVSTPCAAASDSSPLVTAMSATCRIVCGKSSSTGFLVERGDDRQHAWLVTAAHVLDVDDSQDEIELVIRAGATPPGERRETSVRLRTGGRLLVRRHAEHDVAALPVDLPPDHCMTLLRLGDLDLKAAPDDSGVALGDEVWIPGYPAGQEGNVDGWPMLRRGTVASFPTAPAERYPTLHVQAPTFTGDSGALVARIIDGRPRVIGIASGMLLRTESSDTFFEERTTHMPMQLATVVQVSWLSELLDPASLPLPATSSSPWLKSLLKQLSN